MAQKPFDAASDFVRLEVPWLALHRSSLCRNDRQRPTQDAGGHQHQAQARSSEPEEAPLAVQCVTRKPENARGTGGESRQQRNDPRCPRLIVPLESGERTLVALPRISFEGHESGARFGLADLEAR